MFKKNKKKYEIKGEILLKNKNVYYGVIKEKGNFIFVENEKWELQNIQN